MVYSLYQIYLTDSEAELINTEGYDEASKKSVKVRAHVAAKYGHAFDYAYSTGVYEKVAEINAKSLIEVFKIGNAGPWENINKLSQMHSVCVGDVIQDECGDLYAIAGHGFQKLTKWC